jgi:hypothetical protein
LSRATLIHGLILLALAWPLGAHAQVLPVTRLAYSAKYLCGKTCGGDGILPPGATEYTLIEVHNPHSVAVVCSVKAVEDYPGSGIVVPQYAVEVAANGTLRFDCTAIPGGGPCARTGFVEIIAPRQVKVVAVYKEAAVYGGVTKSAVVDKLYSPGWGSGDGNITHSSAFLVGDNVTAVGDTIRHETTITITNMGTASINANVTIVSSTGTVTNFYKLLNPNGFTTVTGADLPPSTPLPFVGSVLIKYPATSGHQCSVEEIIQKHTISGEHVAAQMAMSVVEVQPIPLR